MCYTNNCVEGQLTVITEFLKFISSILFIRHLKVSENENGYPQSVKKFLDDHLYEYLPYPF